jgi:ubiquinone/menaquinone biosynthesis C-methylase UbiE
MRQAKGYVDPSYLDAVAKLAAPAKQRSYELLELAPGSRVVDVGCGPGTDTITLASIVGRDGKCAGVDYDQEMVMEANRRACEAGVADWTMHHCSDSASLPFPDNFFDAARSERLFQHLLDPKPTLAEMIRVVKPDGRVVVFDVDWGTMSIDSPHTDVERKMQMLSASSVRVNSGYVGRSLRRLFAQTELTDTVIEPRLVAVTDYALGRWLFHLEESEEALLSRGLITGDELIGWRAALEEAGRNETFFACLGGVLVAARKPKRHGQEFTAQPSCKM